MILVSGVAGFIGFHLAKYLLKKIKKLWHRLNKQLL